MTLIKKIANCFKREKSKNNNINKQVSHITDEVMPNYMIINSKEKDKLVYSLSLLKNSFIENRSKIKEKEINEIITLLNSNIKTNRELFSDIIIDNEKILDSKNLELLLEELDEKFKKEIISKQQMIINNDNDFNNNLSKIDEIIKLVEKISITIITEFAIDTLISNEVNDKKVDYDINLKINNFNKNFLAIIDKFDKDFLCDVVNEYNKINYITISTVIIDKIIEKIKLLEEDFKNHRYNKYYYEREINRIKSELKEIKKLKNSEDARNNINSLKKELYTKSKDKYDLLYNNEVFLYIEKECNNLLDKINTRIVDINKKKEEDEDKYLSNILKRFKDLELARELILMQQEDKIENKQKIIIYINDLYNKFNNGIDCQFNYLRNKYKTELVILYNGINKVISMIKEEPYITIDHINFRMKDLIEALMVKKEELNNLLKVNNYDSFNDTIIDEKLKKIKMFDN